VALVLSAAVTAPALACTTCSRLIGNSLALPHPKAIEIAVATRAAIEKGLLSDRSFIPRAMLPEGGEGVVALRKVSGPRLVEAWAAQLERSNPEIERLAVHFLFIDTEQSCGLMIRGEAIVFDRQPLFHADARVVTTRATFHALVDGALGVYEAQRLGLLLVEGDSRAADLIAGQPQ
jgi:hypothetical protein